MPDMPSYSLASRRTSSTALDMTALPTAIVTRNRMSPALSSTTDSTAAPPWYPISHGMASYRNTAQHSATQRNTAQRSVMGFASERGIEHGAQTMHDMGRCEL
ncbi:unnamed protein product [Phytophthora lilii]|uniref:Unnamed protein product n=2 Tax=Phytophthora lilii TaxID=2077276 RepID=A0A9W6XIP8_9STRA|nr:unnamed protein product [Phytophthora lilii]